MKWEKLLQSLSWNNFTLGSLVLIFLFIYLFTDLIQFYLLYTAVIFFFFFFNVKRKNTIKYLKKFKKFKKNSKKRNDSGKDIPYWTPAALFPSSKIQRRISEFSWNRPVYKFSWMKNMTWLRLNVLSSKYPSGSFCHTHCLSRSSPFLFGNLIVSLTFLPQNTVHIVCSLFSHSTPAGCARSMLRVSCIIFIHPAFAVKLHGKILLPIFLCGLVAKIDFDKEEEEIL